MLRYLSTILDTTLELLFSPTCLICKRATYRVGICDFCNPIQVIAGNICERCGEPLSVQIGLCGKCYESEGVPLEKNRASLWLTEEARVLIHKIKFQKAFEWFEVFKPFLLDFEFPFDLEKFTLIPVPLHRSKFINRGFNQSELILDYLRITRSIEVSYGLKKVWETKPQSLLNREARLTNLKGSFGWDDRHPIPRRVVLVDDILTTGETLNECASVLKAKGVEKVCGWTLFRTMK